jgi:TPR repeat protein
MAKRRAIGFLTGIAAIALAAPALADVKDGVDAWSRGEWSVAVAEWQGPAQQDDPDALFNLGQAYRLGRGVEQDQATAEAYYLRAAQRGHIRAADTYGLLLFQDGRREAGLPFVQDAAARGNPSAQYLLGVAHFNGDIVGKDWVRAYALLILANGQGLPQAAPAMVQMDEMIPFEQRQQAASLAVRMEQDANETRATELTAAELAMADGTQTAPPAPSSQTPPPMQTSANRIPQPIDSVQIEPSISQARAAVRGAMLATGTEDPGEAGADFARPANSAPPPVVAQPRPTPTPAASPPPAVAARPQTPPTAAQTSTGQWKVQLGAFSVRGNAERLWSSLASRPELRGKNPLLVQSGRLTKLQAGGFGSRAEAQAACANLERAGQACIVTQ